MTIENEHNHEDIVYLITDPDQYPRIVAAITIYKGGLISYTLACGKDSSDHYEFEISKEKNFNY